MTSTTKPENELGKPKYEFGAELDAHPVLVTLSPQCPSTVLVCLPDEVAGVRIAVSDPSGLTRWYPEEPVTDERGAVELVIGGELRNLENIGPVLVRFDAVGYRPAVVQVFGPDTSESPPRPLDGELPFAPRPFPKLLESDFTDQPWPWPEDLPFEPDADPDPPDQGVDPLSGADGRREFYGDPHYPDWDPYDGKAPPSELISSAKSRPVMVDGIGNNRACSGFKYPVRRTFRGRFKVFIFPGSQWDTANGRAIVRTHISFATDFFADYCIELTPIMATVSDGKAKSMDDWYDGWIKRVNARLGGLAALGKKTIPNDEGNLLDEFVGRMRGVQKAAKAGRSPVIVFINEYVTDYNALVSATMEGFQQIGINFIDSKSPKIVGHELIHLLGKRAANQPGAVTWKHESACANALSTVPRRDGRKPEAFAGKRFLDKSEYEEIKKNRGGGVLR